MAARSALLLLGVLTAVAYAPSLPYSFQFDDWNVVVGDPRVQSVAAWWESMPGIRPLTKLTYALNHELGRDPDGFRFVNILLHLVSTALVYRLTRTLAGFVRWSETEAMWGATWVAAVFALHPVQTEAVTYIAGRSTSLAALFALASLTSAMPDERSSGLPHRKLLASLACFALAFAAKETAVVTPLALVTLRLAQAVPSDGTGPASSTWRRLATTVRFVWPHALVATAAVGAVFAWPAYRRLITTSLDTRSVWENLLTQTRAWGFLLRELVAGTRVNADPALAPVTTATLPAVAILVGVALLIGWAAVALVRPGPARWSDPAVAAGVLWTAVWLAPTNSLVARLDVANDRQWYLALVGPAWLVACAARAVVRRQPPDRAWVRTLTAAAAVVVCVSLAISTHARNRVYATEVTFWTDVVQKSPHNGRAAGNLGYALVLACRDKEADHWLDVARRLDPNDVRAAVNLRLLRAGALATVEGRRCPPS